MILLLPSSSRLNLPSSRADTWNKYSLRSALSIISFSASGYRRPLLNLDTSRCCDG